MADEHVSEVRPVVTRAEAKSRALTRYYTGKPCCRGHVCERITSNGRCILCSNIDGARYLAQNPEKARQKSKRRYWSNPDKHISEQKARYAADPEKHREAARARYRDDPIKYRMIYNKYRQKNKDIVNESGRKWRERNKESVSTKNKRWVQQNPDLARANWARRRARKVGAVGTFSVDDIACLLLAQSGTCAYCATPLSGKYHIDHIVPLSRGGTNWPSNLALACAPCNLSKHARDVADFLSERQLSLLHQGVRS